MASLLDLQKIYRRPASRLPSVKGPSGPSSPDTPHILPTILLLALLHIPPLTYLLFLPIPVLFVYMKMA